MRINHEAGIRPELVSRGANIVHSLPLLFVDRCLSYINRLVKSTIVALKSTLYYLFSERLLSYPQHKGQKTEGGLANQSTQRFPYFNRISRHPSVQNAAESYYTAIKR